MFRSVVVLGGANYGAMGLSLLISVILTRRLGPEQFGRLALLLMASQIFVLVVANWTQTGLVQFGAREFSESGGTAETFWARMWLVAPLGLAAAVAMLVFREGLTRSLGIPVWGTWILVLHMAAAYLSATLSGVLQAREHMRLYSVSLLLERLVLLAAVALIPSAWIHQALTILGLYVGSSIVASLWSLSRIGPRSLLPVRLNGRACGTLLSFSLPFILSSWAGLFGANWLDLIVIKWYRPVSDVGAYSLATQLAGVVQQVAIVVSTVWLPRVSVMIANGQDEQVRIITRRVFPYWLLLTSILFCAVMLGMRPALPMLFGPAFERTIPVLALLMLASSALVLFTSFAPIVSAYGSNWALTSICLVSAAVNVLMDVALVPAYGINGAAVATVLAYGTSAGLVLVLAQRRMGSPVIKLSALTAPVVLVCLAFFWFAGVWFYLVAGAAGCLSVFLLVRAFGLFRGLDSGEPFLPPIPALETEWARPSGAFRGWL
jgi:O-antigen/teichoic acid export membrane protein